MLAIVCRGKHQAAANYGALVAPFCSCSIVHNDRRNDIILKVNGEDCAALGIQEVYALMKPTGTHKVEVKVRLGGTRTIDKNLASGARSLGCGLTVDELMIITSAPEKEPAYLSGLRLVDTYVASSCVLFQPPTNTRINNHTRRFIKFH